MRFAAVIVLSVITSIATTLALSYAQQRLGLVLFTAPAPSATAATRLVPKLVGLSEADAKTNLEAAGLKMIIGARTPSPEAKEGTVLDQSLKAGDASAGDAVTVTIASALPKVPDMRGKTVAEATDALTKAGYTAKTGDAVASDTVPVGKVVIQSPAAGEGLAEKGTVSLQASSGPGDVKVPKLTGLPLQTAKAEAEKSNLKVVVQWTDLDETPAYIVFRQDPKPGDAVKPQSEVKLFVNRAQPE